MATALTTIFGSEIKVYRQSRQAERQYVGFAGAHGVTVMHMGTRGRQLVITGRLASSGANYSAARTNCQAVIDSIEAYLNEGSASYSFEGTTFNNVVFDRFELVPGFDGKAFHWTNTGYVTVDFVCYGRELL